MTLLQKARYARRLVDIIAKASPGPPPPAAAEEIPDLAFTGADKDIAATVLGSYSHVVSAGKFSELRNKPLTADERLQIMVAVKFQQTQGLALLSDAAREKLSPLLDEINEKLAGFVSGEVNPIDAGRQMADLYNNPWEDGPLAPLYKDWEWSRLARTEAGFAYSEATLGQLEADGVSNEAIEAGGGQIPIHPSCMCAYSTIVGSDNKEYTVVDPNPGACEVCLATADDVDAKVP